MIGIGTPDPGALRAARRMELRRRERSRGPPRPVPAARYRCYSDRCSAAVRRFAPAGSGCESIRPRGSTAPADRPATRRPRYKQTNCARTAGRAIEAIRTVRGRASGADGTFRRHPAPRAGGNAVGCSWTTRSTRPVPKEEEPQGERTRHQGDVGDVRDQPHLARDRPDADEVHHCALCLADGIA